MHDLYTEIWREGAKHIFAMKALQAYEIESSKAQRLGSD